MGGHDQASPPLIVRTKRTADSRAHAQRREERSAGRNRQDFARRSESGQYTARARRPRRSCNALETSGVAAKFVEIPVGREDLGQAFFTRAREPDGSEAARVFVR